MGWRSEGQLADEITSHIDMQVEDNVRAGMNPAEARRAARLKFGAVDSVKESIRDQRGWRHSSATSGAMLTRWTQAAASCYGKRHR